MTRKQQLYTVCLVLICGILILTELEYLSLVPASRDFFTGKVYDYKAYAEGLVLSLLMGLSAAFGIYQTQVRRMALPFWLAAIFLAGLWVWKRHSVYALQEVLLPFLSLAMSLLARGITTQATRRDRCFLRLCYGGYFLTVFCGGVLLLYPYFEPVRTTYLLLSADVALWSVSLDRNYYAQARKLAAFPERNNTVPRLQSRLMELSIRNKHMRTARLLWTIAANLLGVGLLCRQERIWMLLHRYQKDWLAYRWQALNGNLRGDFSTIDVHFRQALLSKCPLSRIHTMDGPAAALILMALIALAFLLMFGILRELPLPHRYIDQCRGLVFCLLLRSLLGLLADMFLVSSSQVQVLLLVQPWDLASIIALLVLSCAPESAREMPAFKFSPQSSHIRFGKPAAPAELTERCPAQGSQEQESER